jgi:hypothetical protein
MTTDTFTLPDSAVGQRVDPALPTRSMPPHATEKAATVRVPQLRRGGWHLFRQLLSNESATDHLRVLGPTGGPLGAFRLI